MSEHLTIDVTAADVARSLELFRESHHAPTADLPPGVHAGPVWDSGRCCPAACALVRLGYAAVDVGYRDAWARDPGAGAWEFPTTWRTSARLRREIARFDRRKVFTPGRFVLRPAYAYGTSR